MGWVIDPRDPSKMYAGGHPGFFRSRDGEKSWAQNNSGLPATDVHGLGMDPGSPDILYASMVGAGLYRSPDAGENWQPVNAEVGVMGPILVHPREPGTLYVAGMEGDFLGSEDGGGSWRRIGEGLPEGVSIVVVAPDNPQVAYAGVLEGEEALVYRSDDGGKSWEARNG